MGGGVGRDKRLAVLLRDGWRCQHCGRDLHDYGNEYFMGRPGDFATVDHLLVRSRGGTNEMSNLIASCDPCNNRRGDMPLGVFRAHLRKERAAGRRLPLPINRGGVYEYGVLPDVQDSPDHLPSAGRE